MFSIHLEKDLTGLIKILVSAFKNKVLSTQSIISNSGLHHTLNKLNEFTGVLIINFSWNISL